MSERQSAAEPPKPQITHQWRVVLITVRHLGKEVGVLLGAIWRYLVT